VAQGSELWLLEQMARAQNTTSVSTRVIRLKTHKVVGTHGGKVQNYDCLATWHKDQTVRLSGHVS
jgi:hypothetical protein